MSRNGSGTYTAPASSWNPAVNATPATLADWQALLNDLVAAISASVCSDGQTAMTGNLNLGANKIVNLALATVSTDAVRYDQVFGSSPGAIQATSFNGGQSSGTRNKIINGKMSISQRGTSFALVASTPQYTLDRWLAYINPAGGATVTQQLDSPSSSIYASLRATVTTSVTSPAANCEYSIQQLLLGYDIRDLVGRTFTLSFLVRGAKAGVHSVAFRNATNTRSYVTSYSITNPNTWEYKQVTIVNGIDPTGTWNWDSSLGLSVLFCLASGTTFQTTPNTWQGSNYMSVAGQVNELDTVGNIFALSGVQLEVGAQATPFEHLSFPLIVQQCGYFYEKGVLAWTGYQAGGSGWGQPQTFQVPKRTVPNLSFTSISTVNATSTAPTTDGKYIYNNANAVVTGVTVYSAAYAADAEF